MPMSLRRLLRDRQGRERYRMHTGNTAGMSGQSAAIHLSEPCSGFALSDGESTRLQMRELWQLDEEAFLGEELQSLRNK